MNHLGYMTMISILGGAVGICSFLYPWALGLNGFDMVSDSIGGLEPLIPVLILILSVTAVLLSATYIFRPRWFIPFLTFFLGVATLILTSVFTMWSVDGSRIDADMGVWISYLSGIVIMAGSALLYRAQFRAILQSAA